ncbi:MAG: hypothetical protein F4Z25_10975 [Chloroflexi bacterium]|nr:hypothetical protein [Chloroflexota bacterium]
MRLRPRRKAATPSGDPRQAVQYGLRLLSRSARSERDLRERLEARFSATATASALRRLRALGYVDDRAWAAAYVQRPRSLLCSAQLLRSELRARGISHELAEAATDDHDDDRAALAAARVAMRRLAAGGPDRDRAAERTRSRRLVAALARRGFDPGTIERVRSRLRAARALEAVADTP